MNARALMLGVAMAVCGGRQALADPPAAPPSPADNRLVLSTDGSTLSGGSGGGGGSVTWLHSIVPTAVIGAGAEYQMIANSHWTTGSFVGSLGLPQRKPDTHLYLEVHEGSGNIGAHSFHYSLLAAGMLATLTPEWSVQLEERRIDIDTSHGNLPKFGLSYRPTLQLELSASYAQSFGGNLGTKLASLRVDYHGLHLSPVAGVAWGPAAPAVLNLLGQQVTPGPRLREGFLGASRPVGHTEWLLLGDYTEVAGTRRTTVTLMCTVHLRSTPPTP